MIQLEKALTKGELKNMYETIVAISAMNGGTMTCRYYLAMNRGLLDPCYNSIIAAMSASDEFNKYLRKSQMLFQEHSIPIGEPGPDGKHARAIQMPLTYEVELEQLKVEFTDTIEEALELDLQIPKLLKTDADIGSLYEIDREQLPPDTTGEHLYHLRQILKMEPEDEVQLDESSKASA